MRTFPPQLLISVAELASAFEQSDFQRVVLFECFTGDKPKTMLFTIEIFICHQMINNQDTNHHAKIMRIKFKCANSA